MDMCTYLDSDAFLSFLSFSQVSAPWLDMAGGWIWDIWFGNLGFFKFPDWEFWKIQIKRGFLWSIEFLETDGKSFFKIVQRQF